VHKDRKKTFLSSLHSIPETSTIQEALPQVAFKKSKYLNVYVFNYAPHHEDLWEVEI
jgi:hypothetical protein